MVEILKKIFDRTDWLLISGVGFLLIIGLITMASFEETHSIFFQKQLIWISISLILFFILSLFDYRFLRKTWVVVTLFVVTVAVLLALFIVGSTIHGAQSWFAIGPFSIQPTEIAKIVLVILLAKYFSRRHVEIAHIRHIIVSGFYVLILTFLVFLQPDFGSALIICLIWGGMVLVSGISKKHLATLIIIGVLGFAGMWNFAFEDYQKERVLAFLHPLTNLQGSGYNTYQSMIAIGSGGLFGKGVGYGTQSRLKFLPEYKTDFIFAAFAEEWGFIGIVLLLLAFGLVIWRILDHSMYGATNFEILFGIGIVVFFMSQFLIHVGVNLGLLPVTGTTLPFVSYGGSHLIAEFAALGILMGMSNYSKTVHKEDTKKEFIGI